MFGVEIRSFLPDNQRDRCNLPRQGETSHRWFRPLGEQRLVEIVERSRGDAGHGGRTLENILEIVVMILVESTKLLRFLGSSQLPVDVAVLRTVVRLQPKTAVGPQLSLGAKTVERLNQRDQLSRPNRADAGDLAQQFRRGMFPALGQQISPHFFAQRLQCIKLLVEVLGATAHAGFRDLAQPFRTVVQSVDLCTSTGNGPASIQRLDPIHTRTLVTCGFSKSYNHAAQVPSSNVTNTSPRSPWINCRMVIAFVSMMDSITSFPAEFITAIEIVSWWTSMPTTFALLSIIDAPFFLRPTLKTYLKNGARSYNA